MYHLAQYLKPLSFLHTVFTVLEYLICYLHNVELIIYIYTCRTQYTHVYDLCLQNISCPAAVIHYVHEN
jgi:hypothetical protein